jgi:hypothetical protein
MRDHPQHEVAMMGGMWGAKLVRKFVRRKFLKAMSDIFQSDLFDAPRNERAHDQMALKKYVWLVVFITHYWPVL